MTAHYLSHYYFITNICEHEILLYWANPPTEIKYNVSTHQETVTYGMYPPYLCSIVPHIQ